MKVLHYNDNDINIDWGFAENEIILSEADKNLSHSCRIVINYFDMKIICMVLVTGANWTARKINC